jgi:hypothetical protein
VNQTGYGIDYQNFIEVSYQKKGIYKVCFEKKSTTVMEVHFDITTEDDLTFHAGK